MTNNVCGKFCYPITYNRLDFIIPFEEFLQIGFMFLFLGMQIGHQFFKWF